MLRNETLFRMNCKNCNHEVDGNFCSNCGQSTQIDRINISSFSRELSEGVFQVNKGFFYTLKELSTRPGKSIQEYLQGKRKYHFKPIAYVLLLSTIYFLLSKITGSSTLSGDFLEGFSNADQETEVAKKQIKIIVWFVNHYAYTTLMLIPLASFISFKKSNYNYLEHIILNTYTTGQQAIIYSIFVIFGLL